jgi:hypothetical protein
VKPSPTTGRIGEEVSGEGGGNEGDDGEVLAVDFDGDDEKND